MLEIAARLTDDGTEQRIIARERTALHDSPRPADRSPPDDDPANRPRVGRANERITDPEARELLWLTTLVGMAPEARETPEAVSRVASKPLKHHRHLMPTASTAGQRSLAVRWCHETSRRDDWTVADL